MSENSDTGNSGLVRDGFQYTVDISHVHYDLAIIKYVKTEANYEMHNHSVNSAIYIHLSQKCNQQNLKNQSVISERHWLNCIEHKLLNVHGDFLCKYVIIFL